MFEDPELDWEYIPCQHEESCGEKGLSKLSTMATTEEGNESLSNISESSKKFHDDEVDPDILLKRFRHRKIKNKSAKNIPKHLLLVLFREMNKIGDI
jgi:hypothetical protein